jgi:hypothetical protein
MLVDISSSFGRVPRSIFNEPLRRSGSVPSRVCQCLFNESRDRKLEGFSGLQSWEKHLKRELSQCLFRTIIQRDRKRVKLSLGGCISSNTLTSVKIARSLGNLFIFRES